MGERHKWADVIQAYVNGEPLEVDPMSRGDWKEYELSEFPDFNSPFAEYRIKPAEPVVMYKWAYKIETCAGWYESAGFFKSAEEFISYFKELGNKSDVECMCLDYTRTEFPK